MSRFQGGDEGAYLLLFQRYHRGIFRFLTAIVGRAELAEELTQEVFLTLLEKRDSYRRADGVAAWLFTIARNRALRAREREAREVPSGAGEGVEAGSAAVARAVPSPEEALLQAEESRAVLAALAALPEGQREVLGLREYGELSYEEIARVTERSRDAVRNELHRARRALRETASRYDERIYLTVREVR